MVLYLTYNTLILRLKKIII